MTHLKSSLLTEKAWIGGVWQDAMDKQVLEVTNPADGTIIGTVPNMGREETRKAIAAAFSAWPAWRNKIAKDRAKLLRAWFDLILKNQDSLAAIMTEEQGKPIAESVGEIRYAASFIEWFAEEAKRVYGSVIPSHINGAEVLVTKEPVGVCGVITPWNFPAAMLTRKVGAALAAGCTVVAKPASETPYTALALGKLAEEAGLPTGVLNMVTGEAKVIGKELTSNPDVRKISFTGSTAVGKLLMQQCAGTIKKISLELGGNAPFIIFEDADIEKAIQGVMASKFRNSGQTCICANRIFVQDGIYDECASALAKEIKNLKVGKGTEKGVNQGPLISMAAIEKVELLLKDAEQKGGKVVVGGRRHALGGQFFEPTLITGATSGMQLMKEEIFGPVAPLFRFKTEEEVISMANDTEYGLAAYCYTKDLGRAFRVSKKLEYGMVGVNQGMISAESVPFGGMKQSGIGREGSYVGIEEYLEKKYILMGGL